MTSIFLLFTVVSSPTATEAPISPAIAPPPALIKQSFPLLWQQNRARTVAGHSAITDSMQIDSITAQSINTAAHNDTAVMRIKNDNINYELFFIDNKPPLDIAQSKFVLRPYHTNYFYLDRITDSTRSGKWLGSRAALKWQISIQIPMASARLFNSGLFFAFTNKACFDFRNDSESNPVTMKTFQPEVFGRIDLAQILNREELADKYTFQSGVEHESNGGYNKDTSIYQSRGILMNLYLESTVKGIPHKQDDKRRYILEDAYALSSTFRFFTPIGTIDNPDIWKYVGWFKTNGSFEMPLVGKKCYGTTMVDWNLAPGGTINLEHFSAGLGLSYTFPMFDQSARSRPKLPLTLYGRIFSGYNEFLETYNRRTFVLAWGFRFRR